MHGLAGRQEAAYYSVSTPKGAICNQWRNQEFVVQEREFHVHAAKDQSRIADDPVSNNAGCRAGGTIAAASSHRGGHVPNGPSSPRAALVRLGCRRGNHRVVGHRRHAVAGAVLTTVSTDDAYVDGHVTIVAPRVEGQVARVLVDDNNQVRKGDLLVELDKEPFEVAVGIAQAAVDAAQADLAATEAQVRGQEGAPAACDSTWNMLSRT